MRRLLSILLLGLFVLPLSLPVFALGQAPESRLPACCRKGGDHHCMGNMSGETMLTSQTSPNPSFGRLTTRCPYLPAAISFHADPIVTPQASGDLSSPLESPIVVLRNATMRRIARDRSRQKRGPPQLA